MKFPPNSVHGLRERLEELGVTPDPEAGPAQLREQIAVEEEGARVDSILPVDSIQPST